MKVSLKITLLFLLAFFSQNVYSEDAAGAEKKWYESIKISGMLRIRPEAKLNRGFSTGRSGESEYVGQKLWAAIKAMPVDNLSIVLALQDSRDWGADQLSSSGLSTFFHNTGFREAYFNLGILPDKSLDIIAGRQKLSFGDQRLVGAFEWNNVGRSFDALRINSIVKNNSLSLWSSIVQETNSLDTPITDFTSSNETIFNGVYDTVRLMDFISLDAYYLSKLNIDDSYSLKHHTVGLRLTNRIENGKTKNDFPLDFTLEGAYQFGTENSMTVSAYAAAAAIGYTIDAGVKIRIGAEGDIASGDTNSTDNKIETFDNLFPTNHAHYGMADMVSWQNMLAGSVNLSVFFSKKFTAGISYWYIQKLVDKDSWYSVAGGSSANDSWITGSNLTGLVHEVDLVVKSEINPNFLLEGGYSITLPGDAPKDAGNTDPYHFFYISSTAKF